MINVNRIRSNETFANEKVLSSENFNNLQLFSRVNINTRSSSPTKRIFYSSIGSRVAYYWLIGFLRLQNVFITSESISEFWIHPTVCQLISYRYVFSIKVFCNRWNVQLFGFPYNSLSTLRLRVFSAWHCFTAIHFTSMNGVLVYNFI